MGQDVHPFTFLEGNYDIRGLVHRFRHDLCHVEWLRQLLNNLV